MRYGVVLSIVLKGSRDLINVSFRFLFLVFSSFCVMEDVMDGFGFLRGLNGVSVLKF